MIALEHHSLTNTARGCACRFEEACTAYGESGRPELGLALLQQLADIAVSQARFADAAHGYYKLAVESLKVCFNSLAQDTHVPRGMPLLHLMLSKYGCRSLPAVFTTLVPSCNSMFDPRIGVLVRRRRD